MAKRVREDEMPEVAEPSVNDVGAPNEAAPSPNPLPRGEGTLIPGTVILVNREPGAKDITLADGTNVRLAPFSRSGTGHRSKPIPKKLLPPPVRKMRDRGEIDIEEVCK